MTNNTNNTVLPGTTPTKPTEQLQNLQEQRVSAPVEDQEVLTDPRDQEKAHFNAVKQAAERMMVNPYPVSDVRFTIYKDSAPTSSGEAVYVTRFTSLRDGKVTVVPEQQLMTAAGTESGSIVRALI